MKLNSHIISSALIAGTIVFTGCGGSVASGGGGSSSSSSSGGSNCPAQTTELASESAILGTTVCQLDANILDDLILTSDKTWSLGANIVKVGDDATRNPILTIQAGTTVYGKVGGALFIQRGATINAVGTAIAPIIMTGEQEVLLSDNSTRGQWAGLVIAGKATNNTAAEVSFEFDVTLKHGGTVDNDSSGILKYVLVKHAGQPVDPDKEFNSITLGSVGSGTTIDYVESFNGKDDGIELFGGRVNMKHLVLIGNDDDQLDTDEGYQGFIQYVYAETTTSGEKDPSAFEFSSTGGAYNTFLPRAHPKVANFTIVGADLTAVNGGGSFDKYNGIRTKDETFASFVNGEISGFVGISSEVDKHGLWRHQNDGAIAALSDVTMEGVFLDAGGVDGQAFSDESLANIPYFTGQTGNSYNAPAAAQNPQTVLANSSFIDNANYVGANHSVWASGWAIQANGTVFP